MPYGTIVADVIQNTTGYSLGAGNASIMKNRIINGAMVIDQRNAGASVATSTSSSVYTLDRWSALYAQTSKYTVQQNAGSVTPPVGFTNYLGVTSTSAYSVTSTDYFCVVQKIEGYNVADLGWGTADAKTVTLSFQVRSSLTGTFGGAIQNSAQTRSYPFSYTISSANTWTTVSVTIAGDTSGTWLTTNGIGAWVIFNLGSGSTFSGTAGAWATANLTNPTGATSVVGTSGATFYITGVQLEVGSSATGFEYRQYGQEFQLCQRYYQIASLNYYMYGVSAGSYSNTVPYQTTARATPTVTRISGTGFLIGTDNGPESITTVGCRYTITYSGTGAGGYINGTVSVASEL
jgi:hypothetical protein